MEDDVGRRIWGVTGSFPGQDTVKLTVFVGFHECYLSRKEEGSDGEKRGEIKLINEQSCEDNGKKGSTG